MGTLQIESMQKKKSTKQERSASETPHYLPERGEAIERRFNGHNNRECQPLFLLYHRDSEFYTELALSKPRERIRSLLPLLVYTACSLPRPYNSSNREVRKVTAVRGSRLEAASSIRSFRFSYCLLQSTYFIISSHISHLIRSHPLAPGSPKKVPSRRLMLVLYFWSADSNRRCGVCRRRGSEVRKRGGEKRTHDTPAWASIRTARRSKGDG